MNPTIKAKELTIHVDGQPKIFDVLQYPFSSMFTDEAGNTYKLILPNATEIFILDETAKELCKWEVVD